MNRMLLNFKLFSKVLYSFIVLFMIIFFGTLGFMVIEGWSWLDSFYQTIITVSTVGFETVEELSSIGKLFTAFLIITSFGTFAYTITSITGYVVSGDYRKYFKEYKFMKEIKDLKNHVIVCGYGRVGSKAVETLREHHHEFLVIEQDAEIIEKPLELSESEDGEGKIVGYTIINKNDINKAIMYVDTNNKRKLITSSDKTIIDSMEKNEWVGKKIKFKESQLVS